MSYIREQRERAECVSRRAGHFTWIFQLPSRVCLAYMGVCVPQRRFPMLPPPLVHVHHIQYWRGHPRARIRSTSSTSNFTDSSGLNFILCEIMHAGLRAKVSRALRSVSPRRLSTFFRDARKRIHVRLAVTYFHARTGVTKTFLPAARNENGVMRANVAETSLSITRICIFTHVIQLPNLLYNIADSSAQLSLSLSHV